MSGKFIIKEWYWCSTGKLSLYESYLDGKLEGERKEMYLDGQRKTNKFYRNNKLEGEGRGWYKNGQLQWREFYRDDKLEGESKYWYEDGYIQLYMYWINDVIFDEKFSIQKKHILLRLKRNILYKTYKRKYHQILEEKLISDLANIIVRYL